MYGDLVSGRSHARDKSTMELWSCLVVLYLELGYPQVAGIAEMTCHLL